MEFNKTQVKKYLIWTFVLGWLVQTVLIYMYNEMSPRNMSFQLLLTVAMFMPLAGVVLSGYDIKSIGWKPHIKGGAIFFAWILLYIFAIMGSCLT